MSGCFIHEIILKSGCFIQTPVVEVGVFHPGKLPEITGVLWGMPSEALKATLGCSPTSPGRRAWILLYLPEAILGQGRGLEGYFHELKPRR